MRWVPRSALGRGGLALAGVVVIAAAWYLGSPLFIRTTANEALPTVPLPASSATAPATGPGATSAPEATAGATPTLATTTNVLRTGQLQYVDALHNGKGAVRLIAIGGCCPAVDAYYLRFDDVAITNAPDVHVYLSKERGGKWSEATSKYVGALKATNGSFNYPVDPGDSGIYQSVVVWCRQFSVLITYADLGSP